MAARAARRPIRESRLWQAYNGSRYAILFYSLLLMLVVLPVATTIGMPQVVIKFLLGACLLAAVMPNATKHTRLILCGAVLLLIVVRMASDYGYLHINPGVVLVIVGVVGLAAAGGALRFAVSSHVVDSEIIYAALSTYLLAGLFFGQIYWAIEGVMPGSFAGPDPFSEVRSVYYSFVTLATLGYGEFLPRTDLARGVAVFEVIGGQLFLAVMVARLIGLFKNDKL
jgi:hypothetical protein